MKYIPPDQHIRLSFDLEHVDGDDDWQVGIVYSTTENAYQGNMIYFSATSGHNEINFVTPGYFWRVRILHIPTAQDMEFNLDNFHIENLTQDSASKCHAAVISATDYSPFGAPLPGRTYQASEYRFGFNSMEKDDETYGTGNAYDFGARIYDARLGRWMSVDPLSTKYPDLSPYSYCANNSILFIDPNGKEIIIGSIVYIPPLSRTAEDVKKIAESSSFSQQTFEALDYIYQQVQNAKVSKIDDLVSSFIKVTIEESADFGYESNITGVRFSDGTPSSPGGVRGEAAKDQSIFIKFNPKQGLVFKDDKKRSSVVGLAHELDHASEANAIILLAQANGNNPAAYMNRALDYAGDGEEQRAVGEDSLEQIVATPLNQYWRTNYKEDNKNLVKFIATKSVKSTEENQTLSDQEKQSLNNANNSKPR